MRGATEVTGGGLQTIVFQSTLPMRGATPQCAYKRRMERRFQSTLPMRGATSIWSLTGMCPANFNPHSPCGERPGNVDHLWCAIIYFNPHSPCGERLPSGLGMMMFLLISIHTPHAGSDKRLSIWQQNSSYFNPHSPCGERRKKIKNYTTLKLISIHTPHAGSDMYLETSVQKTSYFNPHSPCGERPGRGIFLIVC